MRFLCMCVVVLSGLVAVRCFAPTPESLKAAGNLLSGVLANDFKWKSILLQELDVKKVDFDNMLVDLKLTQAEGTGITPNAIIQRLVTHKGTTGSQLMYGKRVLGIALYNQFMTTLMVHSYLASKYAETKDADPSTIRVCISKIQLSMVIFISKLITFDHSIDIFIQLIDEINVFFEDNKKILNSQKKMSKKTRDIIITFLLKLYNDTKTEVQEASHIYKNINDDIIRNIMKNLKLKGTLPDVISKKMNSHDLYNMIINIDDFEHVNYSNVRLELIEQRFKIEKYTIKEKKSLAKKMTDSIKKNFKKITGSS